MDSNDAHAAAFREAFEITPVEDDVREFALEHGDEDVLLCDGLEKAFVGFANRFGFDGPVAVYDVGEILLGYINDGMTYEEAVEFFDFNVIGAWVGERTPIFLTHRFER